MSPALIVESNSDGTGRRCDSRCYDAAGPVCECVCQGWNHGVGRLRAEANTRAMVKRWIDDAKAENPDAQYKVGASVQQQEMPL